MVIDRPLKQFRNCILKRGLRNIEISHIYMKVTWNFYFVSNFDEFFIFFELIVFRAIESIGIYFLCLSKLFFLDKHDHKGKFECFYF